MQAKTPAVLTDCSDDDEDDETSSSGDERGSKTPGSSSAGEDTPGAPLAEFRRMAGLTRDPSRSSNDPTR